MVLSIATVVGVWIFNYIRFRETPCTTKDQFGLVENDKQNDIIDIRSVPRQITETSGRLGPGDPRLVSVVSADGTVITDVEYSPKDSTSVGSRSSDSFSSKSSDGSSRSKTQTTHVEHQSNVGR